MNKRRQRRIDLLRSQNSRLVRRIEELQRQSDRLTLWRLLTFLALFFVGAALLLTWGAVPWAVGSLLLLIPFFLTVRWHRQVDASITRHSLMRHIKETHLARLTLNWDQLPEGHTSSVSPDHPFAHDLDLVGDRSLVRLLDVSLTQEGGQRLQDWLVETEPDPARTRSRQTVVRDLISLSSFRDRLLLGALFTGSSNQQAALLTAHDRPQRGNTTARWSGQRLLDWLGLQIETSSSRWILIVLLLFVPLNLFLLAAFLAGWLPPIWIASWFIYGAIVISQSRKVEPLFRDAAFIHESLGQLGIVFDALEKRSFAGKAGLLHMLQPLRAGERRPSMQLRRANRILAGAGIRMNPIIAILLNAIFPWDVFWAYRMEMFKRDLQDFLPGWLDLWYELEALFGLAYFAYLNPGAPFAELHAPLRSSASQGAGGAHGQESEAIPFNGTNLGHPLIAADERVGNDYRVEHIGSIMIITGSNMAGKSSFLRTLGVNIALALAGAPVLADSLELIPFRLAASITITDSVADGFSFFYAEVRRLKALLEALNRPHAYPLFFLIDEIFRGTNNRERLIGSRSYVKALLGSNSAGAIATHDLELVKLAEVNAEIGNAHFRDQVEDGVMVFDYKLHQGPCPSTNALRIMELAGLPVDEHRWGEDELGA